jgi:hypothetical protein
LIILFGLLWPSPDNLRNRRGVALGGEGGLYPVCQVAEEGLASSKGRVWGCFVSIVRPFLLAGSNGR